MTASLSWLLLADGAWSRVAGIGAGLCNFITAPFRGEGAGTEAHSHRRNTQTCGFKPIW